MRTEEQIQRDIRETDAQMEAIEFRSNALNKELAELKAAAAGVSIGSIVVVDEMQGWGSKRRRVVHRYRVTKISLGYSHRTAGLQLHGRTIRKDGTDGETREIWRKWTVELPSPPETK